MDRRAKGSCCWAKFWRPMLIKALPCFAAASLGEEKMHHWATWVFHRAKEDIYFSWGRGFSRALYIRVAVWWRFYFAGRWLRIIFSLYISSFFICLVLILGEIFVLSTSSTSFLWCISLDNNTRDLLMDDWRWISHWPALTNRKICGLSLLLSMYFSFVGYCMYIYFYLMYICRPLLYI